MCPSRINTTSGTCTPPTTTPNMQPRHHRNPSHNKKQNTLWNFIYAKLPEGQDNTGTQEPIVLPDTQDDHLHLTPPAHLQLTPEEPQPHAHLQTSLEQNKANDPWGDMETYHQTPDSFRVLSKNVSTLHPQSLDMTAMALELQRSSASVFLAQETNTAWLLPALRSIHMQCSKVHWHIKLATFSSQDNTQAKHHPGGTLTVALNKWASRVIGSGTDEVLG